jgi:type I restriction enzyme S subunit
MSQWPIVRLGQALTHHKDFIWINDLETYKRCRVQVNAQGIVVRDRVLGAEIKTKKQQVCKAGEFLVAEIDAKHGGYGIIPDELEGAIVSSHYFLFGIEETKLDRRFLGYFIRTPGFLEQVIAQGTTNYAAIRPGQVLEYQIPLPPLVEQRRLVERIDALANQIHEGKRLRHEASSASESLLQAERRQLFSMQGNTAPVTLEDVCESIIDTLHSDPIYSSEGVPCVRSPDIKGGRLNLQHALNTSEEEYRRRTVRGEPRPGDIVYCRQGGGTGRAAVVHSGDRFSLGQAMMLLRPNQTMIHPKYLAHQLQSPAVIEDQLKPCYIGTASPRVNIGALRKFRLVLPQLDQQQRIVEYLTALERSAEQLQQAQRNVAEELDAMLPAILDQAFRGELSCSTPVNSSRKSKG